MINSFVVVPILLNFLTTIITSISILIQNLLLVFLPPNFHLMISFHHNRMVPLILMQRNKPRSRCCMGASLTSFFHMIPCELKLPLLTFPLVPWFFHNSPRPLRVGHYGHLCCHLYVASLHYSYFPPVHYSVCLYQDTPQHSAQIFQT